MTTMSTDKSDDENIPTLTDAYYEEQACQEEVYLEETEEERRVFLAPDDPSPLQSENLNEQRERAAEELITGDSDDPPLGDEAVEEMLRSILRGLRPIESLSLREWDKAGSSAPIYSAFSQGGFQNVRSARR